VKPRGLRPAPKRCWLPAVAAALLLAGCPYGSEFPLGSTAEAVLDVGLLGTWKAPPDSEESFTITIRAPEGALLTVEAESPEERPAVYPAFVSAIGAERFLNLRDTAETGLWYFANYRLDGRRLQLRLVVEELFESQRLPDAGQLRAFLQRHLDDPRLYGGPGEAEWDWVLERAVSRS
jgi:hypothetical protein